MISTRAWIALFAASLWLAPLACQEEPAADDDTPADDAGYDPDDPEADWDGDGFGAQDDCNDFDAGVHPDAAEVCGNGLDDDCDQAIDCDDGDCGVEDGCEPEEVPAEDCGDGIDNDEDMATDCDDPDCAHSVYCSPCSIDVSGTCGTSWHVFSYYFTPGISAYSCGGNEQGGEVIYEFLPYEDGVVTFIADPEDGVFGVGGNDVNLYLLEGTCFPDLCVASSTTGGTGVAEEITWEVTAWTYYYLSVEKVGGTSDDFLFSTQCF